MADNDAPQLDPSVLAGTPAMPDLGTPTPVMPQLAPSLGTDDQFQAPAAAPAPAPAPQGDGSAANPIVLPPQTAANSSGTPAQTTPPGSGQPGIWQRVVQGALWGLAGSAGSTHFGGGLAAGAGGYIKGKQQEVENAQNAQKLQFESVAAADSHINALDEHKKADRLDDQAKLDYKQKSAEYQNYLQDNFGIEPNLAFNDKSSEATAGLTTLANQNGGPIPPVVAVHQPEPQGTDGKVAVYSPSQQQMQQNAAGFRNLINTQRQVQGLPPLDDATFNSMGFKGQRDAAQAALEFMKPTPSFTLDKNSPSYLPNVLAQKKQQLEQYQGHKDINGNPDANPNVEKQLQNGIDYLQNAWDNGNKMENQAQVDNIKATAQAKADADAIAEVAKEKAALPFKEAQAKFEQTLKDGNPNDAGALLAQGLIAPSQIISSRQPAFAQQAFKAANDYSMKTTGKPFNAQVQEGYFKAASSPTNVGFFGSAKSLNDQGGTLDQLQTAYNRLPNGQLPVFNKVVDWTVAAAGGGATAEFAQTALGVADDYAKVMGGGAGSDTAREEVLASFARAHSPQQMADAIKAARLAVDSQMNGRIGTNSVMKGMYGDQLLVHVKAPNGGDYVFRNQQQADAFKKQAGIQ